MTDKLKELEDITSNISYFTQAIRGGRASLATSLSVELRKLLSPVGRGNDLLKRIENEMKIELEFPDGSKTLPRTRVFVNLEDYRNRIIFALRGRTITRLELIQLVANQKGAHLDDLADILHTQSKGIFLPLGNLARGGVLLEQNVRYLVEIGETVNSVIVRQVLNKN